MKNPHKKSPRNIFTISIILVVLIGIGLFGYKNNPVSISPEESFVNYACESNIIEKTSKTLSETRQRLRNEGLDETKTADVLKMGVEMAKAVQSLVIYVKNNTNFTSTEVSYFQNFLEQSKPEQGVILKRLGQKIALSCPQKATAQSGAEAAAIILGSFKK